MCIRDSVFDVQAEFDPNPAEGTMDVTLSTIDGAPVYYTLDGTEPTAASPVYEGDVYKRQVYSP